jgi:hypothetical protein
MKPRRHAHLIKAWADGAEIEYLDGFGDWQLKSYPSWSPHVVYRVKPNTYISSSSNTNLEDYEEYSKIENNRKFEENEYEEIFRRYPVGSMFYYSARKHYGYIRGYSKNTYNETVFLIEYLDEPGKQYLLHPVHLL